MTLKIVFWALEILKNIIIIKPKEENWFPIEGVDTLVQKKCQQ